MKAGCGCVSRVPCWESGEERWNGCSLCLASHFILWMVSPCTYVLLQRNHNTSLYIRIYSTRQAIVIQHD